MCLLLHNGLCVDALVTRFVAVLVLAGCATGTDTRLNGDATSQPDGPIDAMVDAPDACVPTPEICDGVDNDCDGQIDEDFHVGTPCDGPDSDLCKEGVIVCAGPNATMCTDTTGDSVEICDGIDNDCDGQIDEGFNVGVACDGPDADLCKEGVIACDTGGGTKCTDTTGDSVEACNGLDDDCDGSVDETFPVGQACSVGLGACLRSGTLVCNATQNGTQCSASPGAPSAETCGNGIDEDCNGGDAACPPNDLPAGAIDISAGGTWTADVSAAHDDNWAASTATMDCGNQGGRDVFYQFALPAEEVVYFDSYGSNFDTVIRVFAGACTAIGATMACSDDQCGTTRSQGAVDLAAGTYFGHDELCRHDDGQDRSVGRELRGQHAPARCRALLHDLPGRQHDQREHVHRHRIRHHHLHEDRQRDLRRHRVQRRRIRLRQRPAVAADERLCRRCEPELHHRRRLRHDRQRRVHAELHDSLTSGAIVG